MLTRERRRAAMQPYTNETWVEEGVFSQPSGAMETVSAREALASERAAAPPMGH